MLALAGEIYYGATAQEREALADEAVAMARRLDDPALVVDACLRGTIAIWRPATAVQRLELTTAAAEVADELGDHVSLASALALRAVAAGELGEIAVLQECLAAGRAEADRVRHLYAYLLLDSLETAWAAMAGRFDQVAHHVEHLFEIGDLVSIQGNSESLAGALMMQALWQGQEAVVLDGVVALSADTFLPLATSRLAMLCRVGRLDEARDYRDAHREEIETTVALDTWFTTMAVCMAAEAACHLGDRELAAAAYDRLAPFAGRPAGAGSGTYVGPVDMFLAFAAHAVGDDDLATRHADEAVEKCERWAVPLAGEWVARERERFGI
jgi:hypothetical protein